MELFTYYIHFSAVLILLVSSLIIFGFFKKKPTLAKRYPWMRLYLNMLVCLMLHNAFLIARETSRLISFQLLAQIFLGLAGICAVSMLGMFLTAHRKSVKE